MTTRRTLLTAGAVASALPSSLLAVALENSSDALETWQQVIVIGSGLAGLTAGASALESGARRVLILEKGPLVGGHSLYSSGSIAAVAPDRAGAFSNGWRDSVEQFVADALAVGGGSGDPERLVQIARGSAAMLDWLEGLGVSFGRPFEARSGLHPRSWAMPGNSAGRSYVLAVMDCYRRLGGKTILSAKVETLERQESCWKVGVTIRSENEVRLKYFQAPAVIIASGGFTANVERHEDHGAAHSRYSYECRSLWHRLGRRTRRWFGPGAARRRRYCRRFRLAAAAFLGRPINRLCGRRHVRG